MTKQEFEYYSKQIAKKNDFELAKLIYYGNYYSKDHIRNLIFSGTYKGKSAVLKVYDDPRLTDEPISLQEFNLRNKSELLFAPELYAQEITTPSKGLVNNGKAS